MSNDKPLDTPDDAQHEAGETAALTTAAELASEPEPAVEPGTDQPPATEESPGDVPPRRGGAGLMVALLALLLVLGAAGGGYYLQRQLQQQVTALPPAIERNSGRIDAVEQRDIQLGDTLDAQRAALERQGQNLQEAVDALRAQIGRDQSGWVLAEAEYLMQVANHRLQLERDVTTATAALRIADSRLRDAGDPALIDVREQLAAEIAALEAVARPDLPGLALRIAGLSAQVDQLPLKGTYLPSKFTPDAETVPTEEGSGWRRVMGGIWSDLKRLVTVRRSDEAVRPMLAPEQQYFLRENLRLELEAARLALLRSDAVQLHSALQTAREWLVRYFDDRAAAVGSMRDALAAMAEVEVRPALPDISGSLKRLRAHMRAATARE